MKEWNINPESLLCLPGKVWVYWKNIEGFYLGCNDLMAENIKLNSRHDIMGRTDLHITAIRKEETELYRLEDSEVIQKRAAMQFYDSATLADGKINFLVIKTPLFEKSGKSVGILGISYFLEGVQDITSSNQLVFERSSHIRLTKRENECLQLLVQGKTVKEAAKALNLSFRTVEDYISNAKKKAGVVTRSQLIEKVFKIK